MLSIKGEKHGVFKNRLGSRTFLNEGELMNSFKAQESIGSEHRILFIMASEGSSTAPYKENRTLWKLGRGTISNFRVSLDWV